MNLNLDFDKMGGLVPAIIQDEITRNVLMLGFMNKESLQKTLDTGKVTFYSRSRKCLWTKGETSGNYLNLVSIKADCDDDTLLVRVHPVGPLCHKGTDTCWAETNEADINFLSYLQNFIEKRKTERPANSYTTELFEAGVNRMAQMVGEEGVSTVIKATHGTNEELIGESADLIYHLMVLLSSKNLRIEDGVDELHKRHHSDK